MKKIFAALLALAMLLCAGSALADGWLPLPDADSTGNITLEAGKAYMLEDGGKAITGVVNVAAGAPVKLHLNGQTLTCQRITIPQDASLELYDTQGGTVSGRGQGVYNYGTFTLHNGEVIGTGSSAKGVSNSNIFVMHGGTVTGESAGVQNNGDFTMHGGTVTGQEDGVKNYTRFTMHGGTVTGQERRGVHICEDHAGSFDSSFTMHGGVVTGASDGVVNDDHFTMHGGSVQGGDRGVEGKGVFRISAGTITGSAPGSDGRGGAVACYVKDEDKPDTYRLATEEEYAACILPGSRLASGGMRQAFAVVERIPAPDSLPQTGDPSMLMGWVCLLGASAAGLKARRKK